jgi:hypothetical protein
MKSLAVNMTTALLIILGTSLLTNAEESKPPEGSGKAQKEQTGQELLEESARSVGGVWVEAAGVKDPLAQHARFESEWGVNKKNLRSKTWFFNGGKSKQIYEGMQFWHPGKKSMVYYEVSFNGDVYEGTISEKDGKWEYKFTSYEGDKVVEYEQHTHYEDDDTIISKVYVKKEDKLSLMHEFKFHRKPKDWVGDDAKESEKEAD